MFLIYLSYHRVSHKLNCWRQNNVVVRILYIMIRSFVRPTWSDRSVSWHYGHLSQTKMETEQKKRQGLKSQNEWQQYREIITVYSTVQYSKNPILKLNHVSKEMTKCPVTCRVLQNKGGTHLSVWFHIHWTHLWRHGYEHFKCYGFTLKMVLLLKLDDWLKFVDFGGDILKW